MRLSIAFAFVLVACRDAPLRATRDAGANKLDDATDIAKKPPPATCAPDAAFPAVFPVPEASAATEVELRPGLREILVVSDSGRKGAAALWSADAGARAIAIAIDKTASDDLEGLAWRAGHVYALTSSGAVRRFSPDGHGGIKRDQDAYALGPAPFACDDLRGGNSCGKNYEGLCLRPARTPARCAGYAASKKEAALYCLVFDGERLVADRIKPPIVLALRPKSLSDCAFGAEGGPAENVLLVTTNVFGGSSTYVVDEASGELAALDVPGHINNEAVAVDRAGALYQFMDDNGSESHASRMTCSWTPPPVKGE